MTVRDNWEEDEGGTLRYWVARGEYARVFRSDGKWAWEALFTGECGADDLRGAAKEAVEAAVLRYVSEMAESIGYKLKRVSDE